MNNQPAQPVQRQETSTNKNQAQTRKTNKTMEACGQQVWQKKATTSNMHDEKSNICCLLWPQAGKTKQ